MSNRLTGDYRKYSDKKYLCHWDLPEGEDLIVTIDHIEQETLENKKKNTTEKKLVLYFAENGVKPLALNKKENPSRIAKALGSTKIENWIGKRISLYIAEESRSEDGLAIRVRTVAPKIEEAFCEECGQAIKPVQAGNEKYSVNKIVELSKAKYGKKLCWDCSMKAKEESDG